MKAIRPSLVLVLIVMITASWTSMGAPSSNLAQIPVELTSDKIVFLVRHAEMCLDQGSNPNLSSYGQERARELARVLVDVNLEKIYSTPFNRTLQTATPISQSQELEINQVEVATGFLESLADQIKTSEAATILVAGHSNTTPRLVNLLVGTELSDLEETEFDRLYIVTLHADGSASYSVLRYGGPSEKPSIC